MPSTVDTFDCLVVEGYSRQSFVMFSVGLKCFLGSYEIVHLCSVQFIYIPVLTYITTCIIRLHLFNQRVHHFQSGWKYPFRNIWL